MAQVDQQTVEYYNIRFGEKTPNILPSNDHDRVRWGVIESHMKTLISRYNYRPSILDFGCGSGWLSALLASYGNVTGVDVADRAIASAQERFPGLEFVCLNAEMNDQDPFFERKFDIIISSEVIEHIKDQDQYMNNLMTVLKTGGQFILTTPNGKWINDWFTGERNKYRQPIENWLTYKQLADLVSPFSLINYSGTFYSQWIFYYPNKLVLSHLLARIQMKLFKIFGLFENQLEKMNQNGKGLYIICVGEKR